MDIKQDKLNLLSTDCLMAYRKETKRRFVTNIHRSFHEESWSETVADEVTILDFAKWYAAQSDEVLKQSIKERDQYKQKYQKLAKWCRGIRENLDWIKSVVIDEELMGLK